MLIAFNKPYGVLCQFTDRAGAAVATRPSSVATSNEPAPVAPGQTRPTLAGFGLPPGIYPAGRLDHDSEGLLLLTDDGPLAHRLTDPRHKQPKTYWVQVEGRPDAGQLQRLSEGVLLNDGPTRPAQAIEIPAPALWTRTPPIRVRVSVPDAWLAITVTEGRNRQVRRMTAAVGLPTLRLVRVSVGDVELGDLAPAMWRHQSATTRAGR